jgi:P27 family predicted phage terminase small subunit
MSREEKYIKKLFSESKDLAEIKKLVKGKYPKVDLRKFRKIFNEYTKEANVVSIDRIKKPPFKMSERALEIWRMFWSNKSKELQILPTDNILLSAFCTEAAIYQEMREVIDAQGPTFKTPKGYIAVRPEVALGNTALSNVQSIAKEFGLTLKSRISLDLVSGVGVQGDLFETLTKKIGVVR